MLEGSHRVTHQRLCRHRGHDGGDGAVLVGLWYGEGRVAGGAGHGGGDGKTREVAGSGKRSEVGVQQDVDVDVEAGVRCLFEGTRLR